MRACLCGCVGVGVLVKARLCGCFGVGVLLRVFVRTKGVLVRVCW